MSCSGAIMKPLPALTLSVVLNADWPCQGHQENSTWPFWYFENSVS